MKENKLKILINKPVSEVFNFVITPPNSSLWISSIVNEKTNEWPIRKGTKYILQNKDKEFDEMTVAAIRENGMVEWVSEDKNYHCRYKFYQIDDNTTEFEYFEWVGKGELEEPFTIEILNNLKLIIEG